MTTRREIFQKTAAAVALIKFGGIGGLASSCASSSESSSSTKGVLAQASKTEKGIYRPKYRFGLGGAPIGGSQGVAVSEEEGVRIMQSSWDAGVRLYDTSPWYGLGLSEKRFGEELKTKKRGDFVLSTKVGRILTPAPKAPKTAWANPLLNQYTYNYTASGTRRSVEDSLERLGLDSIDIVYIHDLDPTNGDLTQEYEFYFKQAANGAMKELEKMKREGIIKGWGLGVNSIRPILETLEVAEPDIFLAACQYTLMDHEQSIKKLFPACDKIGASIMVGSPLNAGFLAGRNKFNYSGKIPDGYIEKRARMYRVAKEFGVDLKTAALQFCAAPSTVSSIIPGARNHKQILENVASMSVKIPNEFWDEMKKQKLIFEEAVVPKV